MATVAKYQDATGGIRFSHSSQQIMVLLAACCGSSAAYMPCKRMGPDLPANNCGSRIIHAARNEEQFERGIILTDKRAYGGRHRRVRPGCRNNYTDRRP